MANINTRLKQKITGSAYETIHYETKTNLCTHDGANLETEVGTLKTAVATGNSLYIDKSLFIDESNNRVKKSIDAILPTVLTNASPSFIYSEGFSINLKRTPIDSLVIEGKFKYIQYPTDSIGSPPAYITLCTLPSDINFSKIIANGNSAEIRIKMNGMGVVAILDVASKQIRLYGVSNKGGWDSSTRNEKNFEFRVEFFYQWQDLYLE